MINWSLTLVGNTEVSNLDDIRDMADDIVTDIKDAEFGLTSAMFHDEEEGSADLMGEATPQPDPNEQEQEQDDTTEEENTEAQEGSEEDEDES